MKSSLNNQRGMALLLVLVVVALLSALLTELAFSTLVDLRLAETFRDSTRAAYLAKGGVRVGRALLQEDRNGWDHPSEFWGLGLANYPVGDGVVSVRFEDLDGRLNINRLVDSAGNPVTAQKDRFIRLLNELDIIDPEPEALTSSLIDWIDEKSDPEEDGAEDGYYMGLEKPYHCKNAPLDNLEELAMVKGFTPEVIRTLNPHVSVYGGETLNINTASPEVLFAWGGWYDQRHIEAVLAAREKNPFKKNKDITDLIGDAHIPLGMVLDSKTFRIESWGGVNDGARTVEAIVRKSGSILYLKVN